MVVPRERSSTSILVEYVKSGEPRHALVLYQQLQQDEPVRLTDAAFVVLLNACAKLKDLINGVSIHAEVARLGLPDRNVIVGGVIVHMYVKCSALARGEEVFTKLPHRNVVSWTSLIAGHVEDVNGHKALYLFNRMLSDKVVPNHVTLVCILKACAILKDVDKGAAIHAEIERKGLLEKHSSTGNTVVYMYAKCGSLVLAQEVFDTLSSRDLVTWTALIAGYVDHGLGDKALHCFEEMNLKGLLPDALTFVVCLKACGLVGADEKAQEIHAEIERQGCFDKNIFVGSALVDLYAKLGQLAKAQVVFDGLPDRNVVIWNALMSGYVEHQFFEEAITCLAQMAQESVLADCVTYVCGLKACSHLNEKCLGKILLSGIQRAGLFDDCHEVGGTLVQFYASCKSLAMAQEVFDRLLVRDSPAWRTLIAGHVDIEDDFTALDWLEHMQLECVLPDTATISWGLKACGNVMDLTTAYELHLVIAKRGLLEQDSILGSTLVDVYCKCEQLPTAQKLFDRLPTRDVCSSNALVTGYAEHGQGEKALRLLERMHSESFTDATTFISSMKACAITGAVKRGFELHTELERVGLLEENPLVGNALVHMYVRNGLLCFAIEVFNRLPIRDAVSWTALMTGYVDCGLANEALSCIELMQLEGNCPSIVTLVCGLKACATAGDIFRGQQLHGLIEKRGLLDLDTTVGNSLIDMYLECGLLATAHDLFNDLPERDVVSWTAFIAKYAENGYYTEALECFELMQHEGVTPDVITFVCSLKACEGLRSRTKLNEVHTMIFFQHSFFRNHFVKNSVVEMYTKCGLLSEAREIFKKLPVNNIRLWNAMIAGYNEQGHGGAALELLGEIQHKGLFPDVVTYIYCLQACCIVGATDEGLALHCEIERRGCLAEDLVANSLVDMYAKSGSLKRAEQLVETLPYRDVVSWTALMQGYADGGECGSVFFAFERMLKDHVRPDSITFVVVLSACSRIGVFDQSWTYFKAMTNHYGIVPLIEHYACVVDLMSRLGKMEEALAVIGRLPFCASCVISHSILSGCQKLGIQIFLSQTSAVELCKF